MDQNVEIHLPIWMKPGVRLGQDRAMIGEPNALSGAGLSHHQRRRAAIDPLHGVGYQLPVNGGPRGTVAASSRRPAWTGHESSRAQLASHSNARGHGGPVAKPRQL